jgi:hypothetical protein
MAEEHQSPEEIEINFRLDEEGRTTTNSSFTAQDIHIHSYEPRSSSANFPEAALDDMLLDCEIADSGLMPRTFWIGVHDKPQFALEQMALDVFHHHVKGTALDDSSTVAGAEWWVQIRPSPEHTGRYAMQGMTEETGITFHWDKDEDLRILCGGNTYIHPHLSTVTYLTDLGSPTLVTDTRIHSLSGEWILPNNTPTSWISWPRRGKHFSFDGRYLHAAPMELMPPGLWEQQLQHSNPDSKASVRRHRRVTFLVNVWLHYKPFYVDRFPMPEKMSGYQDTNKIGLTFGSSPDPVSIITDNKVAKANVTRLTWSMGGGSDDYEEFIHMDIPLPAIQEKREEGGSLQLRFDDPQSILVETKLRDDSKSADRECETEPSSPTAKRMKTADDDEGDHDEGRQIS